MDKIIVSTVLLQCSQAEAFGMFTISGNLEKWLCRKADVEAVTGGKFELFWNPANPAVDSTKNCKYLAVQQPFYVNFEWKGPQQVEDLMNKRRPLTNVTVIFTATGSNATQVTVLHTGWGDSPEWDQAREWFVKAWYDTLAQLKTITG